MIKARHWQDPANAVVAVAVLLSPWVFGYTAAQEATANAVIVGTVLFAVSVGAAVIGRPWVEWAVIAIGGWLVAAPWALDLPQADPTSVAVGFGAVVLALGLWSLVDGARRSGQGAAPGAR